MNAAEGVCSCGARLVGEPLLEPPSPKPMVGTAVASVIFAALGTAALWSPPMLIFGALAVWAAFRSLRASRTNPLRNGGRRTALAGSALGSLALVGLGGWWVAGIPGEIERERELQAVATRVEMYRVASRMSEYRASFGGYPTRIVDLERLGSGHTVVPVRDAWEQRMAYAAYTSGIASRGNRPKLNQNFELRSPGADGVVNTPDDIVMRDGRIIEVSADRPLPPSRAPIAVPVSNRIR